jgi:hypothetical protein
LEKVKNEEKKKKFVVYHRLSRHSLYSMKTTRKNRKFNVIEEASHSLINQESNELNENRTQTLPILADKMSSYITTNSTYFVMVIKRLDPSKCNFNSPILDIYEIISDHSEFANIEFAFIKYQTLLRLNDEKVFINILHLYVEQDQCNPEEIAPDMNWIEMINKHFPKLKSLYLKGPFKFKEETCDFSVLNLDTCYLYNTGLCKFKLPPNLTCIAIDTSLSRIEFIGTCKA